MNPYTEAMKRILKEAVERKAFFEKHPKALAYWMSWYDRAHYASRHDADVNLHDWENPKYALIDLRDSIGDYANFIYDAWCACHHEEETYKGGKPHPLWSKVNKTADDWEKVFRFKYTSLYPDRLSALDQLLCTIGNGLAWNQDGYICHRTVAQEMGDGDIFLGHSTVGRRQLPAPLKQLLKGWRMHKIMFHGFKKMKAAERRAVAEDKKLKSSLASLSKLLKKHGAPKKSKLDKYLAPPRTTLYPMCKDYSLLCKMPEHAHKSYVEAGREVSTAILKNGAEPEENVKIAIEFLMKWYGTTHPVEGAML